MRRERERAIRSLAPRRAGGQLQRFVRHTDGFAMTDEGRGAGKLGLVATHAADTLALCLPPALALTTYL